MLDLRPDAELRRVKGITFQAIACHTHTTAVVLVQGYCRTEKGKIPGFYAGLREGDIATQAFWLPFGEVKRDHIQDTLN